MPDCCSRFRMDQRRPLLVCSPEYYHGLGYLVCGVCRIDRRRRSDGWKISLTRRSRFTEGQVEQRRWYGFWDFGDFMHTYDTPRHEWKYDVGGFAWDDTELAPNLWLWYSFLRTGRADIYRMAEAMTRQSQEWMFITSGRGRVWDRDIMCGIGAMGRRNCGSASRCSSGFIII